MRRSAAILSVFTIAARRVTNGQTALRGISSWASMWISGRGRESWGRGAGLSPPYQRPGQQIVQSLLAIREPDHEVADAKDHPRKPLRKMPSCRAFK